jgi:hypothetical protein
MVYAALRLAHFSLSWALLAMLAGWVAWRPGHAEARRSSHRRVRWLLNACLVSELLVGLILQLSYSAYTAGVRANLDVVLRDSTLRYWNVLHPVLGLVSLAGCAWVVNRASLTPHRIATRELVAFALLTAAMPWTGP